MINNGMAALRDKLAGPETGCSGQWRAISMRLDDYTDEFLNVGVMFRYGNSVEVRMLDSFDRVKCLYAGLVDVDNLSHVLMDVEDAIRYSKGELPDELSDSIRLSPSLFANGADPEMIVQEFYDDVVTLGRPTDSRKRSSFRYQSNLKVREHVFAIMRERMELDAERIIVSEPYRCKLSNNAIIDVDIPLLSKAAAGTIVSGWYKSPLVVENNLLQAASDLLLVVSNTERRRSSMSVLLPGPQCGMSLRELDRHRYSVRKQLDRFRRSGIDIIEAHNNDDLAKGTIDWWRQSA